LPFFVIDIATIVLAALFGARVLARDPRLFSARLIALITLNSICHTILSRYDYGRWIAAAYQFDVGHWAGALNFMRNLTPGLFMVLCFNLFSGERRFPKALALLFIIQMAFEVSARWFSPVAGLTGATLLRIAPALLQTLFVGFALYWTIAGWRGELEESRRRARAFVVFIIGLDIIGSSLLLRVVIAQNTIANYDTHLVLTAINFPILLFVLIFMNDADLDKQLEPERATAKLTPSRTPLAPDIVAALARLTQLLEVEHVYRRPELSPARLAALLGVPEYRLRKLINEQLGYQNFNAFLHAYRIREACRQLRDPQMRRVPILTIALSTGYQSINTFNRGFRDIMDMTPSAYRAAEDAPAAAEKTSPQTG
jgi:AraC-like DNA-binding protein